METEAQGHWTICPGLPRSHGLSWSWGCWEEERGLGGCALASLESPLSKPHPFSRSRAWWRDRDWHPGFSSGLSSGYGRVLLNSYLNFCPNVPFQKSWVQHRISFPTTWWAHSLSPVAVVPNNFGTRDCASFSRHQGWQWFQDDSSTLHLLSTWFLLLLHQLHLRSSCMGSWRLGSPTLWLGAFPYPSVLSLAVTATRKVPCAFPAPVPHKCPLESWQPPGWAPSGHGGRHWEHLTHDRAWWTSTD